MEFFKLILSCIFVACIFTSGYGQGQVSQNLNQILSINEQDRSNPPKSLYVKLNTTDVEVRHMKGTRVMVSGKVKLGVPNLFFLDVLIKKGRYSLFLSPEGGSGLRLEDKERQPMVLQGATCYEDVSYTIYVPESVSSVVLENTQTGDSRVLAMQSGQGDPSFK